MSKRYFQVVIKDRRSSSPSEHRSLKSIYKYLKRLEDNNVLNYVEITITTKDNWDEVERKQYEHLKSIYEPEVNQ